MPKDIPNKYLKEEYISRINRVVNYIDSNLDKELDLGFLAGIAHFSQYHFHRIFRTIIGEPLKHYIRRRRLEQAAFYLAENENTTITKIAFDCGFNSSTSFARAFKEHFKLTPGEWKRSPVKKLKKDLISGKRYLLPDEGPKIEPIKIDVKELPDRTVAYIFNKGSFITNPDIFTLLKDKLFKWAGPRDLLCFPETKLLTIFHDSTGVTDEEKRRISMCITIPDDADVSGEIGKMLLPGGKYAIGNFEIAANEFIIAWNSVHEWISDNGFQPNTGYCYEVYLNDPKMHTENKYIVDIHIPVKPR